MWSSPMRPEAMRPGAGPMRSGALDAYYVVVVGFSPDPVAIEKECADPLVLGVVGGEAEFSCPAMAISIRVWTKDGVVLSSDGRISLSENNVMLTISMLQESDSGFYNCTISNIIQERTVSDSVLIELVVQSELTALDHSPQFLNFFL